MKKIIVFFALIVSILIGYGQPRTSSPSRQSPSAPTMRTPSSSSRPSSPSYSTSRPSQSPSRTVTTTRPPAQTATRPSGTSYSTSRPSVPPSSSVSSRDIYNTRPASVSHTTTPTKPTEAQAVKRDGPAKPGDGHGGHGGPGHNPPPPNGNSAHGSVPPGYNPPPRPNHHPYNNNYHHPHYHRNVYMHRIYWNPWVPVFYLDGFWIYTHNHYFVDYSFRTTYVYTYNNTNTVQIIDYVVDDTYTYCIQKIDYDRYFRVYDKSNRLVAQQKINWRYNELIYDPISGGVWCKSNKENLNLLFVMYEGQLVCYSE